MKYILYSFIAVMCFVWAVQGWVSGPSATWPQMAKFYKPFRKINRYVKRCWTDIEKDCKFQLLLIFRPSWNVRPSSLMHIITCTTYAQSWHCFVLISCREWDVLGWPLASSKSFRRISSITSRPRFGHSNICIFSVMWTMIFIRACIFRVDTV